MIQQIKHELKCYLFSLMYGIIGSLGFTVFLFFNDFIFKIVIIGCFIMDIVILVFNIKHIKKFFCFEKSKGKIFKIIICEILIAVVIFYVFVFIWYIIFNSQTEDWF